MQISASAWDAFIRKMRAINNAAANDIKTYLSAHPIENYTDRQRLIGISFVIANKYGEAAAALACEMYEAIAAATGAAIPAALPAEMPTLSEVAKAINGTLKTGNYDIVADAVGRIVKQVGVDTTLINGLRDGVEWAWIPRGDTCAFCITLASRGWQHATRKAMKNGHAEHIHANCDCTYAVRFDHETTVDGYDPDKYLAMYENAPLDHWNTPDGKPPAGHEDAEDPTPKNLINAMRRAAYKDNPKGEIEA